MAHFEMTVENLLPGMALTMGKLKSPLKTKINQVLNQLKSGKAVIVFDPELETCNILKSDDPVLKMLGD
jgi:uncharacterized protein YheU (UPF0270 family)